jgi:hypothetical protein
MAPRDFKTLLISVATFKLEIAGVSPHLRVIPCGHIFLSLPVLEKIDSEQLFGLCPPLNELAKPET